MLRIFFTILQLLHKQVLNALQFLDALSKEGGIPRNLQQSTTELEPDNIKSQLWGLLRRSVEEDGSAPVDITDPISDSDSRGPSQSTTAALAAVDAQLTTEQPPSTIIKPDFREEVGSEVDWRKASSSKLIWGGTLDSPAGPLG